MKHQDNPFAHGLSVNEDILREEDIIVNSHTDAAGIHISVDLSGARNRLQNELGELTRLKLDNMEKLLDEGFKAIAETGKMINAHKNYRSGLALTNPEE